MPQDELRGQGWGDLHEGGRVVQQVGRDDHAAPPHWSGADRPRESRGETGALKEKLGSRGIQWH